MTSLALNIRLSREGWLLSGQIAGLIKEIKPVKAIIDEIVTEAEAIIAGLKNFCGES